MTTAPLDYIPALIAAFRAGHASDHVHLGYWDQEQAAAPDWRGAQDAMTDLHLDALDLHSGHTVIDVGCGIGGSLRRANDRLTHSTLTGVNIDPRQLDICRTQKASHGNEFAWIHCDAGHIPLPDHSVARVLSLEAMFHFPDRQLFLSEAARLLRPRGRLVCSDIMFDAPSTVGHAKLLDVVTQGYAPWPAPVTNSENLRILAQNAGLVLLDMTDISTHVLPTWDHIVPPHDTPETSPVAAMRDLHRAGLLHYVISVFQKP